MATKEINEADVAVDLHRHDSKTEGEFKEISRAEERNAQYGVTQRGLKPRHVQLMAIGGAIGVGLWVGIGTVLHKAGPLSLILGYAFWGCFFVWPLFLCVAEMCAYLPIRGSIFELGSRLIHPAIGFAMGWTYFFAGTMLICVEYSAVSTVMQYWVPDLNPGVWIAMAMVVCILLNVVAVKFYGEAEFVMASTKIILLFMLVLITLITMAGGNPKGDAYGFRSWNDGAMHPYYAEGSTGKFLGVWSVMIYAAFTIAGPDGVALASGEIQNPRRTIPRVAKLVFYRLIGFYVVGVLAVGIICSSRNANLVDAIENGGGAAGSSPWVVGITNLGIGVLPHIINAFILFSGWSCGNAYLYNSSRTLYSLAQDGQAPRFLLKCTKNGIPIWCVAIVSLITCITFLVTSNSALEVFLWFVDLTTTALIATYALMLVVYIAWFRARKVQGITNDMLPYAAPFSPYLGYWALMLCCCMLLFVGFDVFAPFDVRGFITRYFALAFSAVMFCVGYVMYYRKGYKTFTKPEDADLISGKAEVDAECRHWEEGGLEENERARLAEMNFARRTWEKMW
jgi:amino acid transporter